MHHYQNINENNFDLKILELSDKNRTIIVATFPPPQKAPEAYYVAMVYHNETPLKYITLEKSLNIFDNDQTTTVLGGWDQ